MNLNQLKLGHLLKMGCFQSLQIPHHLVVSLQQKPFILNKTYYSKALSGIRFAFRIFFVFHSFI